MVVQCHVVSSMTNENTGVYLDGQGDTIFSIYCTLEICDIFWQKTEMESIVEGRVGLCPAAYFWLSLTFSEILSPWIFTPSVIIAALIQRVSEWDDEKRPREPHEPPLPSPKINNHHHRNLKVEEEGEATGHLGARGVGRLKAMECDVAHADGEGGGLFDGARERWATKSVSVALWPRSALTLTWLSSGGREGPLSSNCISASLTITQLIWGPLEDTASERDIFISPLSLCFSPIWGRGMMMSIGLFLISFSNSPNLMPGKVMGQDAHVNLEDLKQETWSLSFTKQRTVTKKTTRKGKKREFNLHQCPF